MYRILRNYASLKKGDVVELTPKQAEIFVANKVAELDVKEDCKGCDDKKPCSECEEHAKSKQKPKAIEMFEEVKEVKEVEVKAKKKSTKK